ncbi:hypothetical protein J0H33_17240 [bacterium]|nr:hypothetical protein [bacterium]
MPNAQPSATPVQIAPPAVAPVRQSAAKLTTRTAAAQKSAVKAPAPVNSAPSETTNSAPVAPANTDILPQDSAQMAPAAPIAAPAPVQPERVDSGNAMVWTGLGLLILAALAVIGFFSFRRRKPARAVVPVVERPRVEPRTQPMPTAPAAATAPAMAFSADRPAAAQAAISPRPMAYVPTRNGGAVQLPREMPRTFEERDALLKRMVDAGPDRANPFRSRKARLHRARLILQSLGTRFEDRDPWIDLSQYPDNWPEVARRKFSHAA